VTRRGAILLACATLACDAPAQVWSELGPAPISGANDAGRVSAIVCHPTNPDLYYAGGADGGVWRTDDGGQTWRALTDHMPTTAVGAIAMDPADPRTLYVGTGEANFANHSRYGLGVFKSTDAGETWEHLAEGTFGGRCFSRMIVHPAQPDRVYGAITIAGGFPSLAGAKGHPGAAGPVGVFRSDDGGHSWARLDNGLPGISVTDLAMDPANPDVLYAGVGHIFGDASNGIYKTTDGGDSWSRLGGGLPTSNIGRISLAVAPSDANRLYTMITRPSDANGGGASTLGAFRSDNAGQTWTAINAGSIQATYGWYLSTVSVRPGAPGTVIMGGLSLVRSTNAGANFSTITPPHVDLHAIAWDASGRLLVGDDGGVHRSINLGSSWESLNTGLGTVQFYAGVSTHPTDRARLLGGTQDNGTNLRSTESLVWARVAGGDGGWTQWDQSAPLRLFAESQGTGNLYRSINGGQTFGGAGSGIVPTDRNCFLPPYLIDPTNSVRMLYATHRVYRSLNGSATWTPISPDLTGGAGAIRALAMSPADPMTVYAATTDGRVQVSIDGGQTFTLRLTDAQGWPRVTREIWAHPIEPGTAYLAGATFGAPHVRRTRDRGVTWETLDGDLPDLPVNVVVADARCATPVLYAGTDAGVYVSTDDGAHWSLFGAGFPRACVIDLLVEPGRERLIAATQGRGAWSTALAPCPPCDADVNCDGSPDQADVACIILAVAGDTACLCLDPDVNADGSADQGDVAAVISAVAGQPCP